MIRIALPPEGTIIRDYALLSASMVAGYLNTAFGLKPDRFELKPDYYIIDTNTSDFCSSIGSYYENVLSIVKARGQLAPLKGALHQNDKKAYAKALGVQPSKRTSYVDFFTGVLRAVLDKISNQGFCNLLARELGSRSTKGGRGEVILGDRNVSSLLPPLQPLKIEKYEYGKSYSSFTVKGDVKTTSNYLSFIASAWLLTYMGFYNGMVFAWPSTDTMINSMINPGEYEDLFNILQISSMDQLFEKLYGNNGYYSSVLRTIRDAGLDLEEAYHVIHALEIADYIEQGFTYPIRVTAVNYDGKRFTLSTDIVIDPLTYSPIISKISRMNKQTINILRSLAVCASKAAGGRYNTWRKCPEWFGSEDTAIRLLKILYLALTDSIPGERAVYYMARLSPTSNDRVPPLRDRRVLNNLLYSLMQK